MRKELSSKKTPKRFKVKLRAGVVEYLKALSPAELAAFSQKCRRQGLNVRVDKQPTAA